MTGNRDAIGSIDDLEVFKRAYALSIILHRASLQFPKIEQFGGLADQIRRSSKSVAALIAEGYGKQRGSKVEFRRFVLMAVGSADEARLWCRYAADLGYADSEQCAAWQDECRQVARMLQALATSLAPSKF